LKLGATIVSKKKQTSAGVVITDGERLLIGHATNAAHWDLPKGRIDAGESPRDAAVRELREETSLRVDPQLLTVLGLYDYKPKKDLYLFVWPVQQMPDPNMLFCESTFKGRHGPQPEIDAFKVITWKEIDTYCVPDMCKVLRILEKKAKEVATNA
jgi:8-oxo-dGTP pyrophosphatase MutT (NUDIX family)